MEEWRDLCGHEAYSVSSNGRIMRKDTGRIYKGTVNSRGYVRFDLSEHGRRFVVAAHRAVAEAFIPKVDGKSYVNHKDGNKLNNNVQNLEWCTCSENTTHAFNVLGRKPSKRFAVKCVETGVIYDSALEAQRLTGISNVLIHRCVRGIRKSTHNSHWVYAETN